jgi:hypothetical protein
MNILFSKEQSQNIIDVTMTNLSYMMGKSAKSILVDDLDNETPSIHILLVYGYPSYDIKSKDIEIHKDVLTKYKEGFDIKFLFITLHESDSPDAVQTITNYIKSLGIEESDVTLCTGNELLDINKQKVSSGINTYTNDIIPRVISESMILCGEHPYEIDRENIFQCYNRAEKSHRTATSVFLYKDNLLKYTDFSLRTLNKISNNIFEGLYNWNGIVDSKEQNLFNNKLIELSNEYNSKPIISKYENFEFDKNGPQHNLTYKHNLYKHSYINIVTETQYEWDGIIHITEKSLQPLWFYQLPIIIATPHHIKRMRELYDFDWFDDFINHSYDSIENHKVRFHKIRREILRLSKMESEIKEFFKDNQKRFEHNRKVIKEISKSKKDYNFFQNLIK